MIPVAVLAGIMVTYLWSIGPVVVDNCFPGIGSCHGIL